MPAAVFAAASVTSPDRPCSSGSPALLPGRLSLRRLLRGTPVLGLMLLLTQGCEQPDTADLASDDATELQQVTEESSASAELEEDLQVVAAVDGGRTADAGVKPDAAVAPAARPTSLTFRMTTAPYGGRYAPKNIGAIWVETSTGTFVKTLKRWARIRARYLSRFAASSKNDLTDAISGATLANHRTPHEVKWNLTDRAKARVKDGQYRLAIELTDRDGPGALLYIPFTVGAAPVRLTPTATKEFLGMELKLE
jgi:hypothetical protein